MAVPEDLDERARQAAHQLRRAASVDPPHFRDVLALARVGMLATVALGICVTACTAAVAFAASSLVGPEVLVWAAAAVILAMIAATSVLAAHAGGHAWFVPLPGALLALAWLASVSSGHRHASTWWLLAASAALTGVATLFAAGVLRARVATRSMPRASLVGSSGTVVSPLAPLGIVRVQGETWTAESISGPLPAGAPVHVVRVDGLRLLVWSEHGAVPGAEGLPGE